MKILIAPDKFKGTLTATQACDAIAEGLLASGKAVEVHKMPLADGGEGTAEILTKAAGGNMVQCSVLDPLGRPVSASYGIAGGGTVAFIEMAAASGLHHLSASERNPARTSTVGTGQLISHAVEHGAKEIILAIGGSATNDCGIGMASALGAKFKNARNELLEPVGANLIEIHSIHLESLRKQVGSTSFRVLCDVTNPLTGDKGATRVYGPQKGADANTVLTLEKGVEHFKTLVAQSFKIDLDFPGAGAAGGMGAGAKLFLHAEVVSGIEYILRHLEAERYVRGADLIISGEGKVDDQTLSGKTIAGLASLCRKHNKPLWIVCGRSEIPTEMLASLNVSKLISLDSDPRADGIRAMKDAANLVREKVSLTFDN